MECNKDEALRAAELAQKKFSMHDLAGAKKFALKAMQLFPNLAQAKQMLSVVEVHAAAQLKSDDWYGILQVDPVADDDAIKKQYKKLVLQLHPDKNKMLGAEPAFKLINEAWGILSDKSRRTLYDVKRNGPSGSAGGSGRAFKRPPPPPPPPPEANGYHPPAQDQVPSRSARTAVQGQEGLGRSTSKAGASSSTNSVPSAPTFSTASTPIPPPPSSGVPPPARSTASTSNNTAASAVNKGDTFWTQCPRCKIQYQYYRKYENHQLLCQNCKEGFPAVDIGESAPFLRNRSKDKQRETEGNEGVQANGVNGFPPEQEAPSTAFKQMQQRVKEREEKKREEERRKIVREKEREERKRLKEALKKAKEEAKRRDALERQLQKQREREEKEARKKMMEAMRRKLKRSKMLDDDEEDDDDDEEEEEEEDEDDEGQGFTPHGVTLGVRRSHRARRNVTYRDEFYDEGGEGPLNKKARLDEGILSAEELAFRRQLAEKGRRHVVQALREILRDDDFKARFSQRKQEGADAAPSQRQPEDGSSKQTEQEVSSSQQKMEAKVVGTEDIPAAQADPHARADSVDGVPSAVSEESDKDAVFYVPDSDFYEFDNGRREEDVQEGQVWALYDDADGMPRFYCEIKEVVSKSPFKIRIRWLELYKLSELEAKWRDAGFQMTCGQFKLARRARFEDQINKFSHSMKVEKLENNVIRVYPAEGEVWALYRDWDVKWMDEKEEEEKEHDKERSYEMVEVTRTTADKGKSSEVERSTMVVPLVKVRGFNAIFARGVEAERSFAGKDLLRFSHRVPAHWMTGDEKPNAPKDCWQLDTAAMPFHLIKEEGA